MKRLLIAPVFILICLFSAGLSAGTIRNQGKIDKKTLQKIDRGDNQFDVIVLFSGYKDKLSGVKADNPKQMAASQALIHFRQKEVIDKIPPSHLKVKHRFGSIAGFSGRFTQYGIQTLASLPEVAVIEEDGIVEAHLAQGISLMHASAPRSMYDGTGVSVAIVDTGIDYNHSMLGGGGFPNSKVIGGYDYGDDDSDPLDCQGHGTSVAGIAAGTLAAGPGDYIGGVAPNAKLYALKIVSGCEGSALTSDIVQAWGWAVLHKNDDPDNPILIINTSFGGGKYLSACDSSNQSLAAAANNAVANGITLFGSSGNDAYTDGISSPACVSNSIAVGAVYDANVGSHGYSICTDSTTSPDKVACYSNSAEFLDILAPSHDAYTAALGGGYTSQFGGTSAASPYAAGFGALAQSYAKSVHGYYYSSIELKAKLLYGDPVNDKRNHITKPRLNAETALKFAILKTNIPPDIDGSLSEYTGAESITLFPASGGNTGTVKALWDDEALYLAYEVTDIQLNADTIERDGSVWNEDSVEWAIDTLNNDGGSGDLNAKYMLPDDYHGIVNILNTQFDEQGTVSGVPTSSWNGIWESAVLINGTNNSNTDTDIGYTVEVKIPWTALGFSSAPYGNTVVRMGFLVNDKDASSYQYKMWPVYGGASFPNAANWGEALMTVLTAFYCDDDGDNYIDMNPDGICYGAGCEPVGCQTVPGNDCDDTNLTIHPGAAEVCDLADNNCDGMINDLDCSNSLTENFESGLPSGWTIIDNAATAAVWRFDDPGSRSNITGGSGNFVIADSDYYGIVNMDTELRTPEMDMSDLLTVKLEFKTDFDFFTSEIADVDLSANGIDGPWTNIWRKTGDYWGPRTETIDITSLAAGHTNVMIRFHYYNANYEWWWQVDDVIVTGTCSTIYYKDLDVDGYGNPVDLVRACLQPSGYVVDNSDCDDRPDGEDGMPGTADDGININPGAAEVCDEIDNDCNGQNNEGLTYQLTTAVNPTGLGAISPDCTPGCTYNCLDPVVLTAVEDNGYPFDTWTGCYAPSNGICTMIMNSDKNVTANFNSCQFPVKATGTATGYYFMLQTAYDSAPDGSLLRSQDAIFPENLVFDLNKAVTLIGGYDCTYSTITGTTTLNGDITINNGSVSIEGFDLE